MRRLERLSYRIARFFFVISPNGQLFTNIGRLAGRKEYGRISLSSVGPDLADFKPEARDQIPSKPLQKHRLGYVGVRDTRGHGAHWFRSPYLVTLGRKPIFTPNYRFLGRRWRDEAGRSQA